MAQTRPNTHARKRRSKQKAAWQLLVKGLIIAVAVTAAAVVIFALLMQWLKPSDQVIRVVNQIVKLLSIIGGIYFTVGRGGENGLLRGAAVGLLYMGLGVVLYAVLAGQNVPWTSYLADLAMGVAGGGICGMILSNLPQKSKKKN
jgi:putative membrane protein, TIGR04086 family/integral membrane protein, TIGR04097 family